MTVLFFAPYSLPRPLDGVGVMLMAIGQIRFRPGTGINLAMPGIGRRPRPGYLPWCVSSSIELPRSLVAGDGVCGDEEFSHDGDEGDFARALVLDNEPVVESLEG